MLNSTNNIFNEEGMTALVKAIENKAVQNDGCIFVYPFLEKQGKETVRSKMNGRPLGKNEYQVLREGKLISYNMVTKWGIRIEGNLEPIKATFKDRESAHQKAKQLLKKGLGKEIVLARK